MRSKYKNKTALLLAAIMCLSPITAYAADYRDAGVFIKDGALYRTSKNDYKYYLNNEGGFTVHVPYTHKMSGMEIAKRMFTGLFDIYKTDEGTNYASAGAKVNIPGLESVGRIRTNNYVKCLSIGGLNSHVGAIASADPATTDLKGLMPDYKVEFRYPGISIDKDLRKGTVVTNPSFPADMLKASGGGTARAYQRYDKQKNPRDTVTMYGDYGVYVVERHQLCRNWIGTSGVPSNIPNPNYYGDAEAVFELWASRTDIGKAYKAYYTQAVPEMPWWQFLRDYIRIDGDYNKQSVFLTCVYKNRSNATVYTTYGIPYPIDANTIASKIQILDAKGNVLDYSVRPLEIGSATSGADVMQKNMLSQGGAVKLEVNKTYGIELGLTFASKDKKTSTTNKNITAAAPTIDIIDTTPSENEIASFNTGVTSNLKNLDAFERSLLDSDIGGPIKTNATIPVALSGDEMVSYNYGMAGFKNLSFTVQENFPLSGVLRFVVPAIYDQNGDNSYRDDDYIYLAYTLDAGLPPPTVDQKVDAYGDLNLGQRELRCLHYKKTEMEDNPDKPIYKTDPITGEKTETGNFEQMPVDYEYVTDYGTWASYDSSPAGTEAGKWQKGRLSIKTSGLFVILSLFEVFSSGGVAQDYLCCSSL